jgi:hypothetical protein
MFVPPVPHPAGALSIVMIGVLSIVSIVKFAA